MKYVFTAVFSKEPDTAETYNVTFPDLPGCNTFGDSLEDAISMAQDVLCLWLYHREQDELPIPTATPPSKIEVEGDEFITAISVDTGFYHRFYSEKLVKKTLNIPMWLNEQAERANINFSQTLQKALKSELHISD